MGVDPAGDDVELQGERGRARVSARDWPVLRVELAGRIDPDLTRQWHDAYLEIVGRKAERYVYVIDGTPGGELPPTSRRVIAEFLAQHRGDDPLMRLHVGSIYVLPSALLRGVATAVFWVQQPDYRWKFASKLAEAEAIAKAWLAEERIAWRGFGR